MFLLLFRVIIFIFSLKFILIDYSILLEYVLISLNRNNIIITILLDWISLLFIRFVFFISSIVVLYRKEYIEGDLNIDRFIILVIIFVLSIAFLIISPNLIRILLGWDGLGLVSYCLVIYYQNNKSYNAGILTALTNRLGDVAILISIAWIINYGSWNFIFYLDIIKNESIIQNIGWLIILAAITKSAQIPFSSWLPAAIAAPTPVSSLVHSSTLVTAGVYLLIRFRYCFNNSIKLFLLFISRLTIFISGLGANFEFDLKKIIALSTLRQLGLIIRILALGESILAFFHLLTHALFKALLFICAGNIIHNYMNCQDIRYLGRIRNIIPLTCTFFNIRNLSLCGLPFLSGFYSKDLIVEVIRITYLRIYIYFIFYVSIGLTVCYRFRLIYYLIMNNFNFYSLNYLNEKNNIILKRIIGLIRLVVIIGSVLSWVIFSVPYFISLSFLIKIITIILILIGVWVGLQISFLYYSREIIFLKYKKVGRFLGLIWNIPYISTIGLNLYILNIRKKYYKNIDLGWSEFLGSQILYKNYINFSKLGQILFFNNLKIYLLIVLFWVLLLIIYIYLYLNSLYERV